MGKAKTKQSSHKYLKFFMKLKNLFFLHVIAGVLAFSFALSSCTEDVLPGAGVSKTTKVATMCTVPDLAPRYGCSGTLLPGKKVTGWQNKIDSSLVICLFTNNELEKEGYFYHGKTKVLPIKTENNSSDLFSSIPWYWLGWLLLIGLAVLLFWLLWGLARRLWAWATEGIERRVHSSATSNTASISESQKSEGYKTNYNNCTINNNDNYGNGGCGNCCLSPKGDMMTEKITIERSYFDPKRYSESQMH